MSGARSVDEFDVRTSIVGFTGRLILAQAEASLSRLELLAGDNVELVGRGDDGWQLAALGGDARSPLEVAVLLADSTAAPVLVTDVYDSQAAWLVADSPDGLRWRARLRGGSNAADGALEDFAPTMETAVDAVAWAAEAGRTAGAPAVLEAMSEADSEDEATRSAWTAAGEDIERLTEILRGQTSHIEIYVLRVLAALGFTVRAVDADSWWGYLVRKSQTS
jgi:hypothetical protein